MKYLSDSDDEVPDETPCDAFCCRSAVLLHGASNALVEKLIVDWRRTLLPCTCYSFLSSHRDTKRVSLKNLHALVRERELSHLHVFQAGEVGVNLRIARVPDGPTLHFRVESYTLVRDIISMQQKHYGGDQKLFSRPPIIVLNKFPSSSAVRTKARNKASPIEAVGDTLRSLLDVTTVESVSNIRKIGRILLFSRVSTQASGDSVSDNREEVFIDVRHYVVLGKSRTKENRLMDELSKNSSFRASQKLIKRMDGVASCEDLREAIERDTPNSESEGEEVILPIPHGQGKCKIRLVEIGPRLTLRLLRVDEGLFQSESI